MADARLRMPASVLMLSRGSRGEAPPHGRILDHLGLSPPEEAKPPPTREVVRVPADDEGHEIQAG